MAYGFDDNKEKAVLTLQKTMRPSLVEAGQVIPASGQSTDHIFRLFDESVAESVIAWFNGQNYLQIEVRCQEPCSYSYCYNIGGLNEEELTSERGQFLCSEWLQGEGDERAELLLYIKKEYRYEEYNYYLYIYADTNLFTDDVFITVYIRAGVLSAG